MPVFFGLAVAGVFLWSWHTLTSGPADSDAAGTDPAPQMSQTTQWPGGEESPEPADGAGPHDTADRRHSPSLHPSASASYSSVPDPGRPADPRTSPQPKPPRRIEPSPRATETPQPQPTKSKPCFLICTDG